MAKKINMETSLNYTKWVSNCAQTNWIDLRNISMLSIFLLDKKDIKVTWECIPNGSEHAEKSDTIFQRTNSIVTGFVVSQWRWIFSWIFPLFVSLAIFILHNNSASCTDQWFLVNTTIDKHLFCGRFFEVFFVRARDKVWHAILCILPIVSKKQSEQKYWLVQLLQSKMNCCRRSFGLLTCSFGSKPFLSKKWREMMVLSQSLYIRQWLFQLTSTI